MRVDICAGGQQQLDVRAAAQCEARGKEWDEMDKQFVDGQMRVPAKMAPQAIHDEGRSRELVARAEDAGDFEMAKTHIATELKPFHGTSFPGSIGAAFAGVQTMKAMRRLPK